MNSASKLKLALHLCSSADEYVRRFKNNLSKRPAVNFPILRVYREGRRWNTAEALAKEYCLIRNDQFVIPSLDDIVKCKIVVTTIVTSLELVEKKLKGCFSHIFIDEAAQVGQ